MTHADQQILFNSLGFLAVIMNGEANQKDGAARARSLAWLIEEFCKTSLPENFEEPEDYSGDTSSDYQIDSLLASFKEQLRVEESASLPQDRATLLKMHKRLEERTQNKARQHYPDDLLADLILKMIDCELNAEGMCK